MSRALAVVGWLVCALGCTIVSSVGSVRGVSAADAGSARIQLSNLRDEYDFLSRVDYMMKEAAVCDRLTWDISMNGKSLVYSLLSGLNGSDNGVTWTVSVPIRSWSAFKGVFFSLTVSSMELDISIRYRSILFFPISFMFVFHNQYALPIFIYCFISYFFNTI